jgi:hypothetical protein
VDEWIEWVDGWKSGELVDESTKMVAHPFLSYSFLT